MLAQAYLEGGRPKDTIRLLEKHSNGQDLTRTVLLAQAHYDAFDAARAEQLIREAAAGGKLDGNARAQLLLGQLAFDAGRNDDAKTYLRKVHKIEPDNRQAVALLRNLGEKVEAPVAERTAEEILSARVTSERHEKPGSAAMQIGIALVLGLAVLGIYRWYSTNSYNAKKLAVEAAEKVTPGDAANLQLAADKFAEAREYQSRNEYAVAGLAESYTLLWVDHGFNDLKPRALEYVELAKDRDIEKAERFAAEALAAFGDGKFAEAESIAKQVVERGGVSDKIFYVLGLSERAMARTDRPDATDMSRLGRDNLRRAAELKSEAAHYHTALGDAFDEDNDNRNAAFYWGNAAQRNPKYVPGMARNLLARVRKGESGQLLWPEVQKLEATPPNEIGDKDCAAILLTRSALLTTSAKPGPQSKSVCSPRGASAEAATQPCATGLACVDEAIRLGGETPLALTIRAAALFADGKNAEGFGDLEKAHKAAPNSLRHFYGLVDAYVENGKPEAAVQMLNAEGAKLSQDQDYYVVQGNAYREQGDFAKATEAYDKALKLYEEYFDALLNKGILLWKQKKYDEATDMLRRAVAVREDPEVYVAVGLMWIERGFSDEANLQLVEAEKKFLQRGTEPRRMYKFYKAVLEGLGKQRNTSKLTKEWTDREKAFREK